MMLWAEKLMGGLIPRMTYQWIYVESFLVWRMFVIFVFIYAIRFCGVLCCPRFPSGIWVGILNLIGLFFSLVYKM